MPSKGHFGSHKVNIGVPNRKLRPVPCFRAYHPNPIESYQMTAISTEGGRSFGYSLKQLGKPARVVWASD